MNHHCALRTTGAFFLVSGFVLLLLLPAVSFAGETVTVEKLPGKIRVDIGGKLFTDYIYHGYAKPIFYPVYGPFETPMTRNWPMKKVPGEAQDHKHHKSLWYTHGSVNGVDFWAEGPGKGKIVQTKLLKADVEGNRAFIETEDEWRKVDGSVVCTDTRKIVLFPIEEGRVIDFTITIHASKGDVVFGDTKEGTMGIRTHPNLRLRNDPRRGVTTANGHALNSEGVRDRALWGKRAEWVDYWGKINDKTVGIAIFDHPSNPRHPTWWHARDYGLIAANPFGVHYFEGKPAGTGDYKIPAGESRTWRYRFVFHRGDAKEAKVSDLYRKFAAEK